MNQIPFRRLKAAYDWIKSSEKTVLIDIDSTINNLVDVWLGRYNHDWNDDLKPSMIKSWATDKYVKPECGVKIYDYLTEDLYGSCKPLLGAQEGVAALREAGWKVLFVTANASIVKLEWLRKYDFLPSTGYTSQGYGCLYDKSILMADAMVDDRFDNILHFKGRGILFDQPWNRSMNWKERAFDWIDVEKYLC